MRITAPAPDSRIPLDQIDLARTDLYINGDPHLAWQTLRAERPVFWQSRRNGEGFWAVTRWSDVRKVLSEYQTFSSEQGTAIAMLDAPDPAAGLMMHSTDPPRHMLFREQIREHYSPNEIATPALDAQEWDPAETFIRMPMTVAAMLMDLPPSDIDMLLRLAFAVLAPADPRFGDGTEFAAFVANHDIMDYFTNIITERRRKLTEDVVGTLLTMEIANRRLTEQEILLNCLSLLLGAVVTTSQAISATLIGLTEKYHGEGRWGPQAPIRTVVEEALRWSSPVTHFMRRASRDIELHGQVIRIGEAVTAWIASANRDEAVFGKPFALDLERSPNRHVAFGSGPHLCLGSHLARLMLQESFDELIATIESFELAGEPTHLVSNEIAGVVSLPLRVRLRPGAFRRVRDDVDELDHA